MHAIVSNRNGGGKPLACFACMLSHVMLPSQAIPSSNARSPLFPIVRINPYLDMPRCICIGNSPFYALLARFACHLKPLSRMREGCFIDIRAKHESMLRMPAHAKQKGRPRRPMFPANELFVIAEHASVAGRLCRCLLKHAPPLASHSIGYPLIGSASLFPPISTRGKFVLPTLRLICPSSFIIPR